MKQKRFLSFLLAFLLLPALPSCERNDGNIRGEVNVFNWGEYIDESIFDDFTRETGIRVNYQTFDSNEALYGKLAAGATGYDVIIPSDYMIGQMIEEDMLSPLDLSHIPHASDIDPALLSPAYDPDNRYSVPYMTGILGLIYNGTMVDPQDDTGSWNLLWNEHYKGDILMFDNARDTFGIALKRLGYSYNTTDEGQIEEALQTLIEQRPLVQADVMDEIFDKMEGENAAVGAYYYGDYLTMLENNPDLLFSVPREGTNLYVDAMCIPKTSENKENAEAFIDFMCRPDIGLRNVEETWYSTPLLSVRSLLDSETAQDPYAYPDAAFIREHCETYACLPAQTRALYASSWVRLKIQ